MSKKIKSNNNTLCDDNEDDALPDVSFNMNDCQSNQNLFSNTSIKLV
jgi:hypothetical protein